MIDLKDDGSTITLTKLKLVIFLVIAFFIGFAVHSQPVREKTVEKIVEKPVEVQIVSKSALRQIKTCQDIIKLDEQGFNIASAIMGLFPGAIDAVSRNDVAEINSFTVEIRSYNSDLSALTAKKQAILDDCMNENI